MLAAQRETRLWLLILSFGGQNTLCTKSSEMRLTFKSWIGAHSVLKCGLDSLPSNLEHNDRVFEGEAGSI